MTTLKLTIAICLATLACAVGATAKTQTHHATRHTQEIGYPQPLLIFGRDWLDKFWRYAFANAGLKYTPPGYIYWYDDPNLKKTITSPCGFGAHGEIYTGPLRYYHTHPNSFYCFGDNNIYLDWGLFRDLIKIDDANALVVLAHEWGHHIQHLQVWPYAHKYDNKQAQRELMADCYAGGFFRYLGKQGKLDNNDVAHAEQALVDFGDPDSTPWDAEGAHGTTRDRAKWFLYGFDHDTQSCGKLFIIRTR